MSRLTVRDGRGVRCGLAWAALPMGNVGLAGLLGVSALLNIASTSAWENYLLAPAAFVLAGLCGVVAYKVVSAAHGRDGRQRPRNAKPLAS